MTMTMTMTMRMLRSVRNCNCNCNCNCNRNRNRNRNQRFSSFCSPTQLTLHKNLNLPIYSPHHDYQGCSIKAANTWNQCVSTKWMLVSPSTTAGAPVSSCNGILAAAAIREDEHGGVIVEMKETIDSHHFASSLKSSLSHWTQQGKRSVWIKLPIALANLVGAAVKEGFYYHHAEPGYLMLAKWIPVDEPNALPANASHRLSVGALVMNENKEVLVVQEKNGMLRGMGVWKFPTGAINEGEDICAAAVREVKEETGINTRFMEVLTFRESHKAFFQKSDIFFVCLLQPLSFNIQEQKSEIEAAQWMPFEEYAAQPFVQRYELLKYMVKICRARIDGQYSGFSAVPIKPSFRDGRDVIYFSHNQAMQRHLHFSNLN